MAENSPQIESKVGLRPYITAMGLLAFSIIGAATLSQKYPIPENLLLPMQIAAGSIHLAGRIADVVSTVKLTKKLNEVEKSLGIHIPVHESAEILPSRPTLKDILRPGVLALELGWAVPIALFPPIGILRGLSSFYASSLNNRHHKSLVESTSFDRK